MRTRCHTRVTHLAPIRYLEWGIDKDSGVRLQDSFYVFSAVASTEVGYPLAKDFLYQRTEYITKQ